MAHFDHGIHPDSAARRGPRAGARGPIRTCRTKRAGARSARPPARRPRARRATSGSTPPALGSTPHLIFTAHHADDQVETVLMRALEGSGPAGLAGMAPRRGTLVRPLLPFRRVAILAYVRAEGLEAVGRPRQLATRATSAPGSARTCCRLCERTCPESMTRCSSLGPPRGARPGRVERRDRPASGPRFSARARRVFRCCPCAQRV